MEDFINNLRSIANNMGTAASAIGSLVSGNPAMLAGNLGGRAQREGLGYKTPAELTTDNLINLFNRDEDSQTNTQSDYESIVKIAQDSGYTPSDYEVDTTLRNIRNRNISSTGDGEKDTANEEENTEDNTDTVEYTYKPGDTFGQVLLDLGVSDGNNLWGPAGDVAYYTQQLRDQDMLDTNGNVKLGKKFRLKKRPANV